MAPDATRHGPARPSHGRPPTAVALRLAATPESLAGIRRALEPLLATAGIGGERRVDALLAVTEAAANVVVHAYPEAGDEAGLELEAEVRADALRVLVRDRGVGLRPASRTPGAGLGLPVIARLADHVDVRRRDEPPQTEVELRFARPAGPLS